MEKNKNKISIEDLNTVSGGLPPVSYHPINEPDPNDPNKPVNGIADKEAIR